MAKRKIISLFTLIIFSIGCKYCYKFNKVKLNFEYLQPKTAQFSYFNTVPLHQSFSKL